MRTAPVNDARVELVTYASQNGAPIASALQRTLCGAVLRSACPVVNLAERDESRSYERHQTKVRALHKYLLDRSNHDVYVLFVDGSDVAWAGCSSTEGDSVQARVRALSSRIADVLGMTSAKVIFGAERGRLAAPYSPAVAPAWPLSRCAALRAGVGSGHRHLNSGVLLGRPRDLLPAVGWVLDQFALGRFVFNWPSLRIFNETNDQPAYAAWWASHREAASLDYCLDLVVNAWNMSRADFVVRRGRISLVRPTGACLLHVSGSSKQKALLRELEHEAAQQRISLSQGISLSDVK